MVNPVVATSVKGGIGFFRVIKIGLGIVLFGLVFINFLSIMIETHEVEQGLKYLGTTFFLTTQNIQDESQKIIDRGVIFPSENERFLSNFWEFMKNFGNLFVSLVIVYGWIWLLARFLLFFPLGDSSKIFAAWVLAILLFFLIQMVVITSFTDKSMMTPFLAFKDLGKAIYISIKPLIMKANQYDSGMENISETILNITF